MDKVKWISTIEKVCKHYVLWTSIAMILFVLYVYFYDVVTMLKVPFPKVSQVLSSLMHGLFIFGIYNITICGVSGIGMLFTKGTRITGIVALIAAVSYFVILIDTGDAL